MCRAILLDSGPLGLLMQRHSAGDDCRRWLADHLLAGDRVIVPEIIDYELRRELIRGNYTAAVANLDAFNAAQVDRYLPLTTVQLKSAAQLWADIRNQGLPTADRHALDVDVILAAQALSLGLPPSLYVIATTNVTHLSRFVPADLWENI
jgi:predicted nucleic acid-binding protein